MKPIESRSREESEAKYMMHVLGYYKGTLAEFVNGLNFHEALILVSFLAGSILSQARDAATADVLASLIVRFAKLNQQLLRSYENKNDRELAILVPLAEDIDYSEKPDQNLYFMQTAPKTTVQ